MKKLIVFLLVATGFISCEDDNTCGITDRSHEVYLNFYDYQTKKILDADFDSVAVKFANEDIFYAIDTTASRLPIDLHGSSVDFVLYTDSVDFDFHMDYLTEMIIENEACDPVFRVYAVEASSIEIDSIKIQVLELTKSLSPHVEIYF